MCNKERWGGVEMVKLKSGNVGRHQTLLDCFVKRI